MFSFNNYRLRKLNIRGSKVDKGNSLVAILTLHLINNPYVLKTFTARGGQSQS